MAELKYSNINILRVPSLNYVISLESLALKTAESLLWCSFDRRNLDEF